MGKAEITISNFTSIYYTLYIFLLIWTISYFKVQRIEEKIIVTNIINVKVCPQVDVWCS